MADENTQPGNDAPALPDNANMHEAAALFASLDDTPAEDTPQPPREQPDTDNAHAEGDDTAEQAPEGEGEQEAPEIDAPEFWSAEDKAYWAQVPAELRPVLQKYEHQRIAFANQKAEEAAKVRQEAQAEVKRLAEQQDATAKWWQEAGPALINAFQNKYAKVDWQALARDNPAEYVRLQAEAQQEAAMLQEADRRGRMEQEAMQRREVERLNEAKREAWTKMAVDFPDHFAGEKAAATTERLGKYLLSQGLPAERINAISEASVLAIATKAMLWDEAKSKAATALRRDPATGQFAAQQAPKRVAPGPSRQGNPAGDAVRQVGERFRQSGELGDAAELIRRLNL